MKAFCFLKKYFWICLLILLAILPVIPVFIFLGAVLLPPGALFPWYYRDARLGAKDVVGTWVYEYDATKTLCFDENNTVKWSTTFEEAEEDEGGSQENRYLGFLRASFRMRFVENSWDSNRWDSWDEGLEVGKIVQKMLKGGVNEFIGTYEIGYSGKKIKYINVDWHEINGASVPDAKVKLTTTFDAHYEARERRNVLLLWDHVDQDSGCDLFYKAP